jgi:uncharacterized protein YndB with AHSA1/START domain
MLPATLVRTMSPTATRFSYHRDVPRRDTASRIIDAPVDVVFAALVDPEALSTWLPPGDMTSTMERFDLRPGGSFRMVLKYPDHSESQGKTTPDTDVVEARFVDLVPNARIVLAVDFVSDDSSFDNAMIMRWEVSATDGGTVVKITADNVPETILEEDHAAGLESSLAKLAEYVAS